MRKGSLAAYDSSMSLELQTVSVYLPEHSNAEVGSPHASLGKPDLLKDFL